MTLPDLVIAHPDASARSRERSLSIADGSRYRPQFAKAVLQIMRSDLPVVKDRDSQVTIWRFAPTGASTARHRRARPGQATLTDPRSPRYGRISEVFLVTTWARAQARSVRDQSVGTSASGSGTGTATVRSPTPGLMRRSTIRLLSTRSTRTHSAPARNVSPTQGCTRVSRATVFGRAISGPR
jgi:hypothetical protein